MTTYPAPVGTPPAIQFLSVKDLKVDPKYQRSTDNRQSRRLIENIARSWAWRLCLPLLVSARANDLFVIDGQHRVEGALMRGDIPFLPSCVASYASPAEEAAVFVAANRQCKAITKLDDFHAAQAAGDADTLAIAAIVKRTGLAMADSTSAASWRPGELGFTTSLFKAYRRAGPEAVEAALTVIGSAFAGEVLRDGAALFAAVLRYLDGRTDRGTLDALDGALRRRSAQEWAEAMAGIRGGGHRAAALTATIGAAVREEAARSQVQRLRDRAAAEALPFATAPRPGRTPIDLSKVPSAMEERAKSWRE